MDCKLGGEDSCGETIEQRREAGRMYASAVPHWPDQWTHHSQKTVG